MDDADNFSPPPVLAAILQATSGSGFQMASDHQIGSLPRTLAASKPNDAFLELGTGTGLSTAWLIAGMDSGSTFASVDNDAAVQAIARRHLKHDDRVGFFVSEEGAFLESLTGREFDFIFADTWPGKYTHLGIALGLLKIGGLYVIDDLLPQPNWPEGHAAKAASLVADLEARPGLTLTKMN